MGTTRKRALVMGVTNDHSLGFGAASAFTEAGMEVICATSPGLLERARKCMPDTTVLPCDVAGQDDDIRSLAVNIRDIWPDGFDYMVHAIAYSDRNELKGSILDTSRENYLKTQDISAYSLLAICRELGPQMRPGGGVVTYTFAASRFHSPNYNTMAPAKAALETLVIYLAHDPVFGGRDISVNAISAGPVLTLSSNGVGGFKSSLKVGALRSVGGKNVTNADIGNATLNIIQTRGLTGQTINVDMGIASCGMGSTRREMEAYQRAFAEG